MIVNMVHAFMCIGGNSKQPLAKWMVKQVDQNHQTISHKYLLRAINMMHFMLSINEKHAWLVC